MKLAVLSDIHGNLPGLQAAVEHLEAWQPDLTVVAGDVVNRGPSSAACLDLVRAQPGWHLLRGNQEEYLLGIRPESPLALRPALDRPLHWTRQQLDGRVPCFDGWPISRSFAGPDGGEVRIRHASMVGSRDGLHLDTPDNQLRAKIDPAPVLFVTAHTHLPFMRALDQTLIVNVGSVGTPADGDRRASLAQLAWHGGEWRAEIVRLDYDLRQAEDDFHANGFLAGCGPVGQMIYHEWRAARYLIIPWMQHYLEPVERGLLSPAASVDCFLEEVGLA